MIDYWRTDQMDLFVTKPSGEAASWLPATYIERVTWVPGLTKKCEYCKTEFTGDVCPSCQSHVTRDVHSLGDAYIVLAGYLPVASDIFYLPDGSTIEVNYRCRGPRTVCDPETVIFRFLDCHIVGKWLTQVGVVSAGDVDRVMLCVKVQCEVEMYPERG